MIIDKIINLIKRVLNLNNDKQIPETCTSFDSVSSEPNSYVSAEVSTHENNMNSEKKMEKEFELKNIIYFDDELLMLAQEYKRVKKEYMDMKAKNEGLDNAITILEKKYINQI